MKARGPLRLIIGISSDGRELLECGHSQKIRQSEVPLKNFKRRCFQCPESKRAEYYRLRDQRKREARTGSDEKDTDQPVRAGDRLRAHPWLQLLASYSPSPCECAATLADAESEQA